VPYLDALDGVKVGAALDQIVKLAKLLEIVLHIDKPASDRYQTVAIRRG
jgi:hypothetical protein